MDPAPGPIEQVLTALREYAPSIAIDRLRVKYPADDDYLWFIRWTSAVQVQIESHPGGEPPFLIESDLNDDRLETSDPSEAVRMILGLLGAA